MQEEAQPVKNSKFTYKDMIKSGAAESEEEKEELPIAVEEKMARESLRIKII
jgi:hypothetical protein